ncbi:hypothetical protein D1007_40002 [Hordeum vulgare]|nr:hypothetical protein D1007_40002 [Hordeum vulgare]
MVGGSSGNEEEQPQLWPCVLSEAAVMDGEFIRQMEIMTEHSLHQMGPVPPSPMRVKDEPPSPPRACVKNEPTSPLRQVKDEPTSSMCNRGLHIDGHVK